MKKLDIVNELYTNIAEKNQTPYLLVRVNQQTRVPLSHVKDGKIVLNIAMTACSNLLISENGITFGARFGGKHHDIYVPMFNVEAMYARETGEGVMFELPSFEPSDLQMALAAERLLDAITTREEVQDAAEENKPKRPALRLVK